MRSDSSCVPKANLSANRLELLMLTYSVVSYVETVRALGMAGYMAKAHLLVAEVPSSLESEVDWLQAVDVPVEVLRMVGWLAARSPEL